MAGEKIDLNVSVATLEINGRVQGLYVYDGAASEYKVIRPADAQPFSPPLWEVRIEPHSSNIISGIDGTNTGDETLYLSGEVIITKPDGTTSTYATDEQQADAGNTRALNFVSSFSIGTTTGTYKCEVKLYGRRSTADPKELLDTDIFYVHNYTEAIDVPATAAADYEYRTAATFEELETAAWATLPATLVINPNWWLQFRFNITNNGDEPVNIHIREAQDSTSKIAMTVTDPASATSLLPVYMKQIAPGTSKKIETLAIQLTESGNWHFEGYVYAQRAYPRILDVNEDGEITPTDGILLGDIVSGTFDADSDGYMSDSDIIANNLKVKPYWSHYAFTNMDHLLEADMWLLIQVPTGGFISEDDLRTPPEDAFVLQYDPLIVHAYGYYFFYDGRACNYTTSEDIAKASAVSGSKALRIEDGKLVTF